MNIQIFDDRIPFILSDTIFNNTINSAFGLGWGDRTDKNILNVHSNLKPNDDRISQLIPHIHECIDESSFVTNKVCNKVIINLVRPSDVHFIHTHLNQFVALYYINLKWEDGWYGETIFYNSNNLDDIIYTSTFKPGRIILFDGSIPHAIRPQSIEGPKYRFTISLFFEKSLEKNNFNNYS